MLSGVCCARHTVCDDVINSECTGDDEWSTGAGFKCVRNGKVCRLPQQLLYDNVQDCESGEDLCFDNEFDTHGFVCNTTYVISYGDSKVYLFK